MTVNRVLNLQHYLTLCLRSVDFFVLLISNLLDSVADLYPNVSFKHWLR